MPILFFIGHRTAIVIVEMVKVVAVRPVFVVSLVYISVPELYV